MCQLCRIGPLSAPHQEVQQEGGQTMNDGVFTVETHPQNNTKHSKTSSDNYNNSLRSHLGSRWDALRGGAEGSGRAAPCGLASPRSSGAPPGADSGGVAVAVAAPPKTTTDLQNY